MGVRVPRSGGGGLEYSKISVGSQRSVRSGSYGVQDSNDEDEIIGVVAKGERPGATRAWRPEKKL